MATRKSAAAKAAEQARASEQAQEQDAKVGANEVKDQGSEDAAKDEAQAPEVPAASTDETEAQDVPAAPSGDVDDSASVLEEDIEGIWVRSVPATFRRLGMKFDRTGSGIALDAISRDQLQVLVDEPNLVVEPMLFSDERLQR